VPSGIGTYILYYIAVILSRANADDLVDGFRSGRRDSSSSSSCGGGVVIILSSYGSRRERLSALETGQARHTDNTRFAVVVGQQRLSAVMMAAYHSDRGYIVIAVGSELSHRSVHAEHCPVGPVERGRAHAY